MPRRRRVALAVSALVAASCSFAATAHAMSAPAYRLRLNGICRSYTPKLRKVEADAAAAKQAGDVHQIFFDLGYGVALGLREDQAIEAVAVPAALQTQMAPIIRLFKSVDAHARAFLRDA